MLLRVSPLILLVIFWTESGCDPVQVDQTSCAAVLIDGNNLVVSSKACVSSTGAEHTPLNLEVVGPNTGCIRTYNTGPLICWAFSLLFLSFQ